MPPFQPKKTVPGATADRALRRPAPRRRERREYVLRAHVTPLNVVEVAIVALGHQHVHTVGADTPMSGLGGRQYCTKASATRPHVQRVGQGDGGLPISPSSRTCSKPQGLP